jgi:hypothetical protein
MYEGRNHVLKHVGHSCIKAVNLQLKFRIVPGRPDAT